MKQEQEDSADEIIVGDDNLVIEAPRGGSTVEDPPDGGLRAWFVFLACAVINLLMGIMIMLVRLAFADSDLADDTEIDQEGLVEILQVYLSLSYAFAPVAACGLIFYGYRKTVCAGAVCAACSFLVLSHLMNEAERFFKFCLFGPAAIGSSCIILGGLVPVLEYFTAKRMRALIGIRIAFYIGQIIVIPFLFIPGVTINRKYSFRACAALCVPIAVAGLTLKELKLTMKDDTNVTFIQRAVGLVDKSLLKSVLLWGLLVILLLFQTGTEPPRDLFLNSDVLEKMELNIGMSLAYTMSILLGQIGGAFVAWILKRLAVYPKEGELGFKFILGVVAGVSFFIAVCCFIAPHAVKFGYFLIFSLLYGVLIGYTENMRDDYVPLLFGRGNIRMVEGLLLMVVGIGGVIATEIAVAIDMWENVFRFAGGLLLFTIILVAGGLFYLLLYKNNEVVPFKDNREIDMSER